MKHNYTLLLLLFLYASNYAQQPCPGVDTVNYGGQTYYTVKIGSQCWLKQNLNVGIRINASADPTNNDTIEKYCYNNDPANCTAYGGLYQWNEAMQYVAVSGTKGICPPRWHIPSASEFMSLGTKVNNDGNALKMIGQGTGTNSSGFSALMAGSRNWDGSFLSLNSYSDFWGSTKGGLGSVFFLELNSNGSDVGYYGSSTLNGGYSVRCLYDSLFSDLPVELGLLTAVVNEGTIQLNWETITEVNANKYELNRALVNSKNSSLIWNYIGSVKAAGTSTIPQKYSFTDKNLQSGKYLYRLKMIDNDGTFEYSKIIEAEVALPGSYELSQNYPNPFNPATTIHYSLAKDGNVKITVYNAVGSRVATLVNENKAAGNYSVQFNANNLPGGIYMYKMESGNYSAVKKFILLK
jgi:uncharacterized protein (TIGR02145 family)